VEDAAKSYHAKARVSKHDIFDNRLIFGDNLLALKALEQADPPQNRLADRGAGRRQADGIAGESPQPEVQ